MSERSDQAETKPTERGYPTPEAAAVGGIPPQYVTVLGTVIHGDRAEVWMLTNDQPPYEPYVVLCVREADGWWPEGGNNGFGGAPAEVVRAAAEKGYFYP